MLEFVKILFGLFIFILPSYLLSLLIFKKMNIIQRIVFGFGFSIILFSLYLLLLSLFEKASFLFLLIFYLLYLGIVIIANIMTRAKFSFSSSKKQIIKFCILMSILIFVFYMTFLPHLKEKYYLPFHGDEWIHWAFTRSFMESGSIKFTNPFTGSGKILNPEIGFHIFLASFKWLSFVDFQTIFLYMPSFIAIFVSLTAFCIGETAKRKFGYVAAFTVAFIPTTVRILGPSFLVPVSLGLFFILFSIFLLSLQEKAKYFILPFLLIYIVFMHPPTYVATIIVILSYSIFLAFEKKKESIFYIVSCLLPIALLFILPEKYLYAYFKMGISAIFGEEYESVLPSVKVSFSYFSNFAWVLFFIGSFFSIFKGKNIERNIFLSATFFLIIIFMYDKYGYGLPIMYDRSFMYAFLMISLLIAYGISELARYSKNLAKAINYIPNFAIKKHFRTIRHYMPKIISYFVILLLCFTILIFAYPTHKEIIYYKLVSQKDFNSFDWLRMHIDEYKDANHSFDKAAVLPKYAGVFSAVTGIYTISSNIWPVYGKDKEDEVYEFIMLKCNNTDFLEKYDIGVVYAPFGCENENLTKIYDDIYLYYGNPPKANFTFMPQNPKKGEKVVFIDNSTTSYGRILKWEWNFGDGNISKGEIEGLLLKEGDYIESKIKLNESFSIEMWIKPNFSYDDGNLHRIFYWGSKNAYITCYKHSNGRIYFVVKTTKWSAVYSTIKFNADEWHHLVCMYNGRNGEFYLYWDGNVKEIKKGGEAFEGEEGTFRIGWKTNGYNGIIRDVKIYNRLLNGNEVENNYKGNVTLNGLVAWWKFDKAGDFAYDCIGNKNATLYGGKWINYAEHVYKKEGEYEVSLTVWNDDGLSDMIRKKLVILS